jgi:hypothetical protein
VEISYRGAEECKSPIGLQTHILMPFDKDGNSIAERERERERVVEGGGETLRVFNRRRNLA